MRVAEYLRRSSPGEEDKNYSIENQRDDVARWSAASGHVVAKTYSDPGGKSYTLNRPVLNQLMEDARQGQFDAVVVGRYDRFSRSQVQQSVAIHQLRECGVQVISATQPVPDGAVGDMMRNSYAFAAELELENIRARTYAGKRARVHSGKLPPISLPKYGYSFADDRRETYIPNPETAPMVRRIYEMFLDHGTVRSVARQLTAEHVPTPSYLLVRDGYRRRGTPPSNEWRIPTVFNILTDTSYIGRMVGFATQTFDTFRTHPITGERIPVRRQVVRPDDDPNRYEYGPDVCPPLVSEELFYAVQERLRTNKERAARNTRHPVNYLLRAGLAVCGYCGHGLAAYWHKTDGQHRYICNNRNGSSGICPSPVKFSIRAETLDKLVWDWFIEQLTHPELIAAAYDSYLHDAGKLDEQRQQQMVATEAAMREAKEQQDSYLAAVGNAKSDAMRERFVALAEEAMARYVTLEAAYREAQAGAVERERDAALILSLQQMAPNALAALQGASLDDRREALYRCKVRVTLWESSHEPRYEITWLRDYVHAHLSAWTQFISRVA